MEIDQEIFNIMLQKVCTKSCKLSLEIQNFPMQGGSAPLQPPPGALPLETPIAGQQFGPSFPTAGSAPDLSQGLNLHGVHVTIE